MGRNFDHEVRAEQLVFLLSLESERRELEELTALDQRAEPLGLLDTADQGLQNVLRTALHLLQLQPDPEIAGQQPEANGQVIGMQPIADQMIEVMTAEALLDG